MNTSIQNRPLATREPIIAFSSLPLRKKRLLFASPRCPHRPKKLPKQARKSTGKNLPTPRPKHRICPVSPHIYLIDGKYSPFSALPQPAKIDQMPLRENDRFSTLVLAVRTPANKIGEAKANQQLTRKFLANFSCNFIRLHVTISLWSKSDQSGVQWKKTAKLSQSGRLTASSP